MCCIFQEEFEDTKGVIRIRISKKNRQHNGKKKIVQKDKQQYTKDIYKTKDQVTRTPLKTGGDRWWSGRVSSSCSTSDTCCINLVTIPVIIHERGFIVSFSCGILYWLSVFDLQPLFTHFVSSVFPYRSQAPGVTRDCREPCC